MARKLNDALLSIVLTNGDVMFIDEAEFLAPTSSLCKWSEARQRWESLETCEQFDS